jgi:hypothetical protein
MDEKIGRVGIHFDVTVLEGKDINGRFMIRCNVCGTYAHHWNKDQGIKDLEKCACNPNCQNCKALRNSGDTRPAVPENGSCNDRLHTCPYDGNRWWQANNHFHHWQQVTNPDEWNVLQKENS